MKSITLALVTMLAPARVFAVDCAPRLAEDLGLTLPAAIEDRGAIQSRVARFFREALGESNRRTWKLRSRSAPGRAVVVALESSKEWIELSLEDEALVAGGGITPVLRLQHASGRIEIGGRYDQVFVPIAMRLNLGRGEREFALTLDWGEEHSILALRFAGPDRPDRLVYHRSSRDPGGRLTTSIDEFLDLEAF